MKTTTVMTLILIGLLVGVGPMVMSNEQDNQAIETVMRDYLEGWYTGNAERLERALHPDLAKRGVFTIEATGRTNLNPISASGLVEYARAGYGKLDEGEDMKIEITVLDVYKNTATVKASSLKFIDYCHLAKVNGEWKIVNILWEPI